MRRRGVKEGVYEGKAILVLELVDRFLETLHGFVQLPEGIRIFLANDFRVEKDLWRAEAFRTQLFARSVAMRE